MSESALVREAVFPDGTRVNMNMIQSRSLSGDTLTLNYSSGTPYSYVAGTGLGQWIMQQLDNFQSGVLIIQPVNFTLINIDQGAQTGFDITSATVDVRGTGFTTGMKLRFEDTGGGTDSNGYYMTCTFISQTHMTAVYGGAGDTSLGPGTILVYLDDSSGNHSNVVSGSNPSGTIVTIP